MTFGILTSIPPILFFCGELKGCGISWYIRYIRGFKVEVIDHLNYIRNPNFLYKGAQLILYVTHPDSGPNLPLCPETKQCIATIV